jgi:hypothetical protein
VRRASRRWFWAGVVGALALTAAGAGAAVAGILRVGQVETAIEEYFAAVTEGRAADALALGDIPDGDRSYLTREVLALQNEIARIEDLRIGAISRTDTHATAEITYRLSSGGAGVDVEDSVTLDKDGWRWRLSATAASVAVTAPDAASRIALAGTALPEEPVLLFPGAVPARTNAPVLDVDRTLAVARFAAQAPVTLQAVVSEGGAASVSAAVDAAVADCLGIGGGESGEDTGDTRDDRAEYDPSCPTTVQGVRFVPGSMSGTLTVPPSAAAPSLAVLPDSSGRVVVAGTFQVAAQWQELNFYNLAEDRSGDLTLRYSATVTIDEPLHVLWGAPS